MVAQKLAPVQARLPDPGGIDMSKPEEVMSYLTLLTASLSKHLQQRPLPTQSQDQVLLRAPGGATFKVKVNDAGVITATPFGSANIPPAPP